MTSDLKNQMNRLIEQALEGIKTDCPGPSIDVMGELMGNSILLGPLEVRVEDNTITVISHLLGPLPERGRPKVHIPSISHLFTRNS